MRVVAIDDPDVTLGPGERGELVFRRPMVMDGYFTIVDRKTDMILTAGLSVSPEVERVLCTHHGIRRDHAPPGWRLSNMWFGVDQAPSLSAANCRRLCAAPVGELVEARSVPLAQARWPSVVWLENFDRPARLALDGLLPAPRRRSVTKVLTRRSPTR